MTSAPLPFDPIAEAARNWADKGWDAEAEGMAFVTSVVRVHQILMARIDASLEPFGLTFSRFEVLMLLLFTRKGQLPLGKIGGRLQVHAASVTNAIDRLEASGLVQRVPHPTDGRTTLARITPEVKEVLLALNPNIEGEATTIYLTRLLKPLGVEVTRLARGIPIGGDLEFADEATLSRAIEGRVAV